MKLPINSEDFSIFIEESNIFKLTHSAMMQCLKNWFIEDEKNFIEDMHADLKTVMNQYHFINAKVSIEKDFSFEPVVDEIICMIEINDEDNDYCMSYRAFFDYNMNIIDDVLCP